MRQIKFRGIKDGTKADWAYGGFHSPFEDVTQIIESVRGNASQMTLVYKYTVGQFTGFKDKNGVDIYEGDIIDFEDSYDTAISFQEGTFGYDGSFGFVSLLDTNLSIAEVIGNIYEIEKL